MSHFVLLVAMDKPENGDVEGKLAEMLHPFDENEQVEKYKDYEDCGAAENYWLYTSLARTAEEVANNDRSSVRPYKPNEYGISSAYDTKRTEDQQWAEMQEEAEKFKSFSNPTNWPEVIAYANNRWYPEGEAEDNESSYLYYDAEQDKAYTWSTYNPDSKWDWYQVGGRWSGYFPVKLPFESELNAGDLIHGKRSWTNENQPREAWTVDGGPKRLLDLDGLRDKKGGEAAARYDLYQSLTEGLPEALPWSVFVDYAQAATGTHQERSGAWDKAREDYRAQPRVSTVKDHEEFRWSMSGCEVKEFSVSREYYIEKARQEAVPGFALLTKIGDWVTPGDMGWFGISAGSEEDTAMFKAKANGYIESLSDDTLLIAVDLHI